MHVTYKPENGSAQEWEFTTGRVRASEAQVMERVYGGTWEELAAGIQSGQMRARSVLLWHLFRRDGHLGLRFEDVPDFYADEVEVAYDAAELERIRDGVAKSTTLAADRKEAMLAGIDKELAEAREREAAVEPGKPQPASSTTPPSDGGSSSPQS